MGGKPKPAQRTKGNLKAAKSSNYNAEPLDTSSLIGFAPLNSALLQSSLVGFGLDESNLSAEFDAGVNENFQIVMRKMSKKDPTTKIKALKEFIDLVNESDESVVLSCMSMYSRLYVALSTDIDARVRESAQNSLMTVVNKIGKHLATILKQIFPAWICSQYDTNPTAASIATNSFQKAFPAKKVSEVFAFCETEILESFIKNITVLNPQTICNVKTYSPEECEAKYERVVIATLRGYSMYLQKISAEKIEKSTERNLSLVGHDKFWSLHKSKSAYIRSAFFEALSSLLQHAPSLLRGYEARATSIVFKVLDEHDPSVLSHIWTCILLTQISIESWWTHVDIGKVFLPKLWKILKTALYPSIIYPNLLPLISKFNTSILPNDQLQSFNEKFFENLNYGLRNVSMAKSDLTAVAAAYFEVLQFTIVKLVSDSSLGEEEKLVKCNTLVDDHIIAVIFWCINTDNSLITKTVFNKISGVVKHWMKNAASNAVYQQVLERFWNELYQVLKGSIESNCNLQQITNGHLELIKNLKNNSHATVGKSVKIKVGNAEEMDERTFVGEPDASVMADKMQEVSFDDPLNILVKKLCSVYVQKVNETFEVTLIENLETLIKDYQSKELFKHLASDQDDKNICSLYDTFAKWLQNDDLRCEAIVEIILVLYKYLETSEKIDLLNRWIQIPSVQKNWLIMRALSFPLCCDAGITKFLKMKEVTNHLAECAKQVTNGNYKDNLIILQKCFFQTEIGDILIDVSTCRVIVDIISRALHDDTKVNQLDQCGSFLAQIFSTICSDGNKKDIQLNIFLALFDFTLNRDISDDVSEDTMWEVSTAWQDALSSGDIVMEDELLSVCSEIVQKKLGGIAMLSTDIEKVELLAQLVSKLILCSNEDKYGREKSEYINKMIESLLKFDADTTTNDIYVQDLSASIELLRGEIIFTKTSVSEFADIKFSDALDTYIKHRVFQLNVILLLSCNVKKTTALVSEPNEEDSENENDEVEFSELNKQRSQDEEVTEDYCDLNESLLKEWSGAILDKFIEASYGEAVLTTLLTNLKILDRKLEDWIIYIQERLQMLVENVSETIQGEIREKLFELASERGEFYARSLHILLRTKDYSGANGKNILFEDVIKNATNKDDKLLSYVNILQTFDSIIDKKSLPMTNTSLEKSFDLLLKASAARSLMKNHLDVRDFNEMDDRKVIGHALMLLNETVTVNRDNPFLLYNKDVSSEQPRDVLTVASIAHLTSDCLNLFPTEIDVKRWDFIRIALSSWVLSVSKSSHKFADEKVKTFIVAIFKLNASLQRFIISQKTKSSTEMLTNVIDEWENVFAKDVNLVLIKSFIHIIKNLDYNSKHQEVFVDALCPYVEYIDFSYVLLAKKIDQTFSLDDLIEFALENLSSKNRGISVTAATIVRQLTRGLIKIDQELLIRRNSEDDYSANTEDDEDDMDNNKWHILETFRDTLENYEEIIRELIEDFSFKSNDLDDDAKIAPEIILPYYLLWHCILNFCTESPADLRSYYAHWISLHKYEETFLLSLFKMMPREIVKNPEIPSKLGHAVFEPLKWSDIQERNINMERYSAFLYMECLRQIPAIVRKWWHSSSTRQAQLIDKLTSNYVSPILCQEDLTTLTTKKERDGRNSMHIRVLTQVREIIATYSLEEARMELLISLPQNYPLGATKVECKKHIGGKFQAREIIKQLSIYLTHQNGRLYDGIYIWKRNLDRKFEGVEECFVCYSVLHQENLQLPRLACKTCKKKFHSTCLYRWFTSSNGSTCPLCRNVF